MVEHELGLLEAFLRETHFEGVGFGAHILREYILAIGIERFAKLVQFVAGQHCNGAGC